MNKVLRKPSDLSKVFYLFFLLVCINMHFSDGGLIRIKINIGSVFIGVIRELRSNNDIFLLE